jgi:cytochrome c peroxidase
MIARLFAATALVGLSVGIALAAGPHAVSQKDKAFNPTELDIQVGETVVLHNDDTRTHNIRVYHPQLDFNSGAQEPGEDVRITFDDPGTYYVTCGIHPQMELKVEVTETDGS